MSNAVIEQMNSQGLSGLSACDLMIDGKLHRFKPDWEKKANKKRGWYVLFNFRTDSGTDLISGSFGWFKGAEANIFNVSLKTELALSANERSRLEQEQIDKRQVAELERQNEARQASEKSYSIFNGLSVNGHSPYQQRKKIADIGVRHSRDSIALPVQDVAGKLTGLQFIDADGNKRFLTGTVKKGRFCPIGDVTDPLGFIGVTEGYATGVSCHMATAWPVFVAFDAGNLEHVAKVIREKYPQSKIVIFGDDDRDNPENPGRNKAEAAAYAVGGVALFPSIEEVVA